ncbi:glycosyltransferase family 61 protein [Paenibacillus koleovorans]|uniref:glycosyltransferase family 61 protein n=1 Tax=Paenibacillus koleovorans TaxID=121608 RepID=UPI000FDC3862|nr:glycosyltransferase family 61 protein [Paenibacillus koleovorans]
MTGPLRQIPSAENHHTVKEWLNQHAFEGGCLNNRYLELPFAESETIMAPKTIDTQLHWCFQTAGPHYPLPPFAAVIEDGRLFGRRGIIMTSDHKLLKDVSVQRSSETPDILPRVSYTGGTTAVLTFKFIKNYFHWMLDVLPRILLLRELRLPIDKYVISPQSSYPYLESMHMLGVPKEKIVVSTRKLHLQAQKLIVTSRVSYKEFYPKWSCDFVRNELLAAAEASVQDGTPKTRIYISREGASKRKVTNEAAVMKRLAPYGFHTVRLETMSLKEQIHLFRSADVILAPHGAALTNLIFARPGTKVIELFSPDYVKKYYWVISSHYQLDYYYLIGAGARHTDPLYPNNRFESITVNLNDLDRLLELAELHRANKEGAG